MTRDQPCATDVHALTWNVRLWHQLSRQHITTAASMHELLNHVVAHARYLFTKANDTHHAPNVARDLPTTIEWHQDVTRKCRWHRENNSPVPNAR